MTFLGGSFYSISMLPPFRQNVTLFNPVVYLVSGVNWSFYGVADLDVGVSLAMKVPLLRSGWESLSGCSRPGAS